MKIYKNTILKSFILLQIFILCGCSILREDLSECDLYLKFRYDYNLGYEDWFSKQVKEVKVFIFDKEGKYVQTLSESGSALAMSGYKMKIPYEQKGYTAVVWAGKTSRDYQLPELIVGDPIEKLTLHYKPENNISSRQIDALWHSGPHVMTFPEASGTEQTISLIRNTNDFYITLHPNASTEPVSNFDITIKGANGSYNHKNDFIQGSPVISYSKAIDNTQERTGGVYTLRLIEGASLLISMKDENGKNITIEGKNEVELIELLLKGKPEKMTPQEYLDRKYIWEIGLNYDVDRYMALSITINDWTYWFHNIDL